jgi:hypothetical protein
MAWYICSYSKPDYARQGYEGMLEREIQRIIATACGAEGGNFKKKIPLHELINYKCYKETEKFKKYVGAVDFIKTYVNCLFPFIEIEGLDLSWTTNEIIDVIMEAYRTRQPAKLVFPPKNEENVD